MVRFSALEGFRKREGLKNHKVTVKNWTMNCAFKKNNLEIRSKSTGACRINSTF